MYVLVFRAKRTKERGSAATTTVANISQEVSQEGKRGMENLRSKAMKSREGIRRDQKGGEMRK